MSCQCPENSRMVRTSRGRKWACLSTKTVNVRGRRMRPFVAAECDPPLPAHRPVARERCRCRRPVSHTTVVVGGMSGLRGARE